MIIRLKAGWIMATAGLCAGYCGMRHLNEEICRNLVVPLTPVAEKKEIARKNFKAQPNP